MVIDEPIRSPQNPQVKEWAALITKKGRERSGCFLVEGAHLVSEALRCDAEVDTVIYVPGSLAERETMPLHRDGDKSIPWVAVTEAVMAKITDTVTPQGVAAVVKMPAVNLDDLFRQPGGCYVAVDAVQDPGNLGTVIRSADAVGATALLLGMGTVDVYNPKSVRASMGSIFHVPIISCDLQTVLPLAQKQGVRIVATSLGASRTCYETDLTGAVCFLVGNEGAGVSERYIDMANETVIIPIPGQAESLNVAMATTVLLYEGLRQRAYPTQIKSSQSK